MATKKRLLKIAHQMLFENNNVFYLSIAPRMSMREYQELCNMGFWVQSEYPLHEPRMFYMMSEKEEHNLALFQKLSTPFQPGQLVVCNLDYYTVKAGDKVRVIKCDPGECQSGWLVTATRRIRGRMPTKPSIAISGVDSSWFTPC